MARKTNSTAELAERVEQTAAARAQGGKTMDELIEQYSADFIAAMTPEARDRLQGSFVRLSLNVLRWQPELRDCDRFSFIGALMSCAAMGLEPPDPARPDSYVYFKPRNVNVARRGEQAQWVKKVEVDVDYRGLIHIAQRTGAAASITAEVVHANDHFDYWREGGKQRLTHRPAGLLEEPGEVVGAYAVAEMLNGSEIIEVLRLSDLERARKSSESYRAWVRDNNKSSPWVSDFEAMARKTAVRRVFKWLPKSPEATVAFAADGAVVRDVPVLEAPGDVRPVLDVVSEPAAEVDAEAAVVEVEEEDPERPFETEDGD